ncbi:hypothetical protein GALLR39Z86_35510 [Glycomyces algeriensis]|uniref:Uncharacterized protein n=1 Tax=Glycomyces algeriensis TaxID=256037 RepID=A0A9W6GAX4_9ACTN|nr:hypothetical protein GALLR39Z86_35510 [Glycomyces algeriensis]
MEEAPRRKPGGFSFLLPRVSGETPGDVYAPREWVMPPHVNNEPGAVWSRRLTVTRVSLREPCS